MKVQQWSAILVVFCITAAQPVLAYRTCGMIDSSGKTILPCVFNSIRSFGHGLFFAEYMHKDNPLNRTFTGRLVDNDGKTIRVNVPADSELSMVYLPPAQQNDTVRWDSLPAGTILQFNNLSGNGLCRLNGDIILEAAPQWIGEPNHGYFPICNDNPFDRRHVLFTLDSATGKQIPAPTECTLIDRRENAIFPFRTIKDFNIAYGYMARNGEVVISPRFATAGEFSPDGLAAVAVEWEKPMDYIDMSGTVVSPNKYDVAEAFIDGFAVVGFRKNEQVLCGLIDRNFNLVLPARYRTLTHLFDHTYGAEDVGGGPLKAITADGKTVFSFPENVVAVYGMSDDLIVCQTKVMDPKLVGTAYFDRSGKVVTLPGDGRPDSVRFGLCVVPTKNKGSLREWRLENAAGKVLIPSQSAVLQVVSKDRILKYVANNHFNAAVWKEPNPLAPENGTSRYEQFGNLLADYNLIGMTQSELEKLIGPPSRTVDGANYYVLVSGPCGNSWRALEIEYAGVKVLRWREVCHQNGAFPGPWLTTNMIYNPAADPFERRGKGAIMSLVLKP